MALSRLHLYFSDILVSVDVRVKINSCGTVRCERGWRWDPPEEQFLDFDLWYVWSGVGKIRLGEDEFPAHRGRLFVLRPHSVIHGHHDPYRRLGVSFVHFNFITKAGKIIRPPASELPAFVSDLRDPDLYDRLMRQVVTLSDSGPLQAAERLLESVLLALPHDRLGDFQAVEDQRRESRIAEVVREIRENPGELFTITELADRVDYSVDHFTRLFTQTTGVGPKEFAIRVRIERAQNLLLNSELPVQAIAQMLGYADLFFFSKQFKQRTGLSPSAYRISTR